MTYANTKRWRNANRSTYQAGAKRYYSRTQNAANSRNPWTQADDDAVLARNVRDVELSSKLGRSVKAIQIRRSRLLATTPKEN